MPLTNAEKQKRARDKRNATLARYEAALRAIAGASPFSASVALITMAEKALATLPVLSGSELMRENRDG